ncbi:MAG: FKBP-type peptidyl-prolyl cis-trans isomerase [Verrucomicrobia bacterium]|nr:FKBP-type peptidyl-prolyl cis-trans isomerase [Verrucomicrobiota bacterium]
MNYFPNALLLAGALAGTALAQAPQVTSAPRPGAPAPVDISALDAKFKSPAEKNSYAIGVMIANDMLRNLKRGGYEADPAVVARAFADAFTTTNAILTTAEAEAVVRAYSTDLRAKAEEKRKAEGEKNKAEGEKFLAENKDKDGVITLPSGLQYKVITAGTGPKPSTNDTVVTHYKGTLLDGTEFDSSISRGQPATFGVTRVIKGWTEALQLMPVGSKWQLFIPGDLAYGAAGSPPKIGPNAVLTFDIELLEIKPPAAPTAAPAAATATAVTSDIIKVPSKAELEKGAKIEVIKKEDVEKLQQEAQKAAPPK